MAKGEKTIFYLVQGSNGVIIHKDEERAEACQKYIKESLQIKSQVPNRT